MRKNTILFYVFIVFIFSCTTDKSITDKPTEKYVPVSQELFDIIMHMDSVLFNALNSKDIETLKATFSDSLEFYHDKDGLQGYAKTIENSKSMFENKNLVDLRRDLVPGSMEVYPIKNYGAIQTGSHTFCHTENGKLDCGTFKFVQVWQNKNGIWKLARVMSYGHK